MIVPRIVFPSRSHGDTPVDSVAQCIESVEDIGLFGKVVIALTGDTERQEAVRVVERVGGRYRVHLELDSYDESFALSLLNAGAEKLWCAETPTESQVPPERIGQTRDVPCTTVPDLLDSPDPIGSPDLLGSPERKAATVASIAAQWKQGQDHWFDVDGIENPRVVLADVLIATLTSDRPDGLWPTVIVDPLGIALGLAYSNAASLRQAISDKQGVYFSRSRNELWVKGKTSGAVQQLLGVGVDCDFDTLRFRVKQGPPGFCHRNTHTCFGQDRSISEIVQRLNQRVDGDDAKSFTRKLFDDPEMLRKKLLEEAQELSDADSRDEAAWEAADVLYFSLIALMRNGAEFHEVYEELARRMQRVVRRKNKLEE